MEYLSWLTAFFHWDASTLITNFDGDETNFQAGLFLALSVLITLIAKK